MAIVWIKVLVHGRAIITNENAVIHHPVSSLMDLTVNTAVVKGIVAHNTRQVVRQFDVELLWRKLRDWWYMDYLTLNLDGCRAQSRYRHLIGLVPTS